MSIESRSAQSKHMQVVRAGWEGMYMYANKLRSMRNQSPCLPALDPALSPT